MSSHIGDNSAAARNRAPIYEALGPRLSPGARVLEIGSGQAVHARYVTAQRPDIAWQMSEAPAGLAALRDSLAREPITAQPAPITLDVRQAWPAGRFTMIFGANVAHIMPMAAVRALFEHGAPALVAGGCLCLYGPFFDTQETPGADNQRFDAALRAREIEADVVLKATRVDGIYAEDPEKNPHAVRYNEITYQDVLRQGLEVMDAQAIHHCMEHRLPIVVFNYQKKGNIERVIAGERIGTRVIATPDE